jgi:hypothetical protein
VYIPFRIEQHLTHSASPYALLQGEGAPELLLSAGTWPFPKSIGAEKPKFSIFMPSRILPVLNLSLPRACMHKSALVAPHIINSPGYFAFKVGIIQWITTRLDTVFVGTSDATIGSILLLVNFKVGAVIPIFVLGNGLDISC